MLLSVRGIEAFPNSQKILRDILAAKDDETLQNNLDRLKAEIQASPVLVTFLLEHGLLETPGRYFVIIPGGPVDVQATLVHLPWIKVRVRPSELPDLIIDPTYGMQETEDRLTARIGHGKFCDQIIDEIRRIRFMCIDRGRTVLEIRVDYPDYAVWKVVDQLPPEERDIFNHPRMWGPVVGYAEGILCKHYGKSPHTISSWRKIYRKYQKA